MGSQANKPSASPDVRPVLDAVRRLVRVLRVNARAAEKSVGLSAAQLFVLQQLAQGPARSLGELAERTHTDPSSVSVVVARLERARLVARRPSPEDARRFEVHLTPQGRATLARAPAPVQVELLAALVRLPAAERRALGRGLTALLRELGEEAAPASLFFEEPPPSPRRRRTP